MGKIGLFGIAGKYLGTLRSYRTGKPMVRDVLVQLVVPGALALAAVIWPLEPEAIARISGNVISGVSIISGLLCGVAVMLFELRMQMRSQVDPKPTKRETTLVDETFHDIMWATVAGFASVLLMIAGDALASCWAVQRTAYGLAIFFLLNFILVTCMCLKRLSATYSVVSEGWSK